MDHLLGIDLGSTSIKAVIFDTKGNMVSAGSTPTVVNHPDPDHSAWAIWEPRTIWDSVCRSIREALHSFANPADIKAAAVSGWGMDGLPMDGGGNCLYPFISWHCPRTEPQSRAFKEKVGAEKIFSINGTQVLSIHSVYRMMWMYENQPEIMEKTDVWLLIEDFVNYMLCGEIATDFSMASCTGLLDMNSGLWSDELLGKAGIERPILPPVKQSGTLLGTIHGKAAAATGLKQGTPVILGGHDYHCAALACGAFRPGVIMDITGTWEMLFSASTTPDLSKEVFDAGLIVERHVARDMFNYVAFALSAGMLEWFKNNFADAEQRLAEAQGVSVWDALMKLAKDVPAGSQGVFFLPHFAGAVTPHVDNRSLGAFAGLSENAGKGVLLRALIEGLDYQFLEFIVNLEKALGENLERIVAVGGTSRNSFWMQNKADVSGKTVEVPGCEEATPLGTAMLAGIGAGIYADEAEAYRRINKTGIIYTPDQKNHDLYRRYFEIYRQLYPSLKTVSHMIFDIFRS